MVKCHKIDNDLGKQTRSSLDLRMFPQGKSSHWNLQRLKWWFVSVMDLETGTWKGIQNHLPYHFTYFTFCDWFTPNINICICISEACKNSYLLHANVRCEHHFMLENTNSDITCEQTCNEKPHLHYKTRKHSSRMRPNRAITRMSSDQVTMRPIVDRMTDACENITFPCGR